MKPTLGQVVHYTSLNVCSGVDGPNQPAVYAAIVTKVYDADYVALRVFLPPDELNQTATGVDNLDKVPFAVVKAGSDDARGGWSWPRRAL